MIIVDIWGGFHSMDHVARFFRRSEEALQIARLELTKGFLVNLRLDTDIEPQKDWDTRHLH